MIMPYAAGFLYDLTEAVHNQQNDTPKITYLE